MATLGRVPAVGDSVEVDGWSARVVDMDGQRVDRVRLERDATGDEPDDDAGEVGS
jgi:CBS domain containing-hemolysin-like protein